MAKTANRESQSVPVFCGVDAGKSRSKVAAYMPGMKSINDKTFMTCYTEGASMDDDYLENKTFIFELDGKAYKIGYAGQTKAEPSTSKRTEVHRVCYHAAIALSLSCINRVAQSTEYDNVICAFSIPANIIMDPMEVAEYKKFIFADCGTQHKARLKLTSGGTIREVNYTVTKGHIFPEGIGASYLLADRIGRGMTFGIVDIGYLNTNAQYYTDFIPYPAYSLTEEKGYQHLVAKLKSSLTNELKTNFNNEYITGILQKDPGQRYIAGMNSTANPDAQRISSEVFKQQTRDFAIQTQRMLTSLEWPLSYMTLIFVGGTSLAIRQDLFDVFGDGIIIPEDAHYSHVNGILQKLALFYNVKINEEIEKASQNQQEAAAS